MQEERAALLHAVRKSTLLPLMELWQDGNIKVLRTYRFSSRHLYLDKVLIHIYTLNLHFEKVKCTINN